LNFDFLNYKVLTKETVKEKLVGQFGEQVTAWEEPYGMLTFTVPATANIEVMQYLHDEGFQFLTDLTAVHYPDRKNEELCIVYHLHNLVANLTYPLPNLISGRRQLCSPVPTGWKEKLTTSTASTLQATQICVGY